MNTDQNTEYYEKMLRARDKEIAASKNFETHLRKELSMAETDRKNSCNKIKKLSNISLALSVFSSALLIILVVVGIHYYVLHERVTDADARIKILTAKIQKL